MEEERSLSRELILAEEIGKSVARSMHKPPKTVKTIEERNVTKTSSFKIEDYAYWGNGKITGSGLLRQLLIKANSSSFSFDIYLDNGVLYQGTWSDLNSHSEEYIDLAAFHDTDNGVYIISIAEQPFAKGIETRIVPHTSITFSTILLKLELDSD